MKKQSAIDLIIDRISDIELPGINFLVELAFDLSWYWNHAADEVWEKLDKSLWEETHNPWVVLQTVSLETLKRFLTEPSTQRILHELESKKPLGGHKKWFEKKYDESNLTCIAYFCMEYMLSEALPIYSGGLGNVAGDQLKAANDMGVPVVAIGLLYQRGYFRQKIRNDGMQEELYPYNDPQQLPIMPLRNPEGELLRIEIEFPGYSVWLRCWEVKVGQLRLYLLDSNDVANYPLHRGITGELYGGGHELRIQQEILLGIGGWRLLQELDIDPEVCHLNEGHAAFAILERARHLMLQTGQSFEAALAVTRAGNLFTTHTAVAAGFDRFSPQLINQYLGTYAKDELKISVDELLALGRLNPHNNSEPFNMAYLAIAGSGAINGVSQLHESVSRNLFKQLFPRWPIVEVPVGHITNGVHMRSWDSQFADTLWTKTCGKDRWMGGPENIKEHFSVVSDEQLWEMRNESRKLFVQYIRKRVSSNLAAMGASPDQIGRSNEMFDPDTLTLIFARRFAEYKRPNLLLKDPQRLIRLLSNSSRPVQLVIAGKAHPGDPIGHALIKQWVEFSKRPDVCANVVFLNDYDMYLTGQMVQGADVWLNNPRRPWEASGTSGMKVLVNGGLNFSVLDGWWNEAYDAELGWALGDGNIHGEDYDMADAEQLYHILETEIVPMFYERNEKNIPLAWTAKMRNSMAKLTPRFSTNRTLLEYTEKYYIPAADGYRKRLAANGQAGNKIKNKKLKISENWHKMKFGDIQVEKIGTNYQFKIQIFPGKIDHDDISVELYADEINGSHAERVLMEITSMTKGEQGWISYIAQIDIHRPAEDYTPRIIPAYENISVPLEDKNILWQR